MFLYEMQNFTYYKLKYVQLITEVIAVVWSKTWTITINYILTSSSILDVTSTNFNYSQCYLALKLLNILTFYFLFLRSIFTSLDNKEGSFRGSFIGWSQKC